MSPFLLPVPVTTIAVSPSPAADPLIDAIRSSGKDDVQLVADTPSETAWRLNENECDIALVSPLVYAARESELSLMGGAGVSAVGPTGETLLLFNAHLHHISTVAYADDPDIDSMLCEIVLREKYHMRPTLAAFNGTPSEALARFDAVLVRNAAGSDAHPERSLDLVDEWYDMAQLPFVRQVATGWEHRITADLDALLHAAGGIADAMAVEELGKRMSGRFSPDEIHFIPGHYRYGLDEDAFESLQTFFRYAFYHGLHRDIPLLKLWSAADEAPS